jgi:hypothetical protein
MYVQKTDQQVFWKVLGNGTMEQSMAKWYDQKEKETENTMKRVLEDCLRIIHNR